MAKKARCFRVCFRKTNGAVREDYFEVGTPNEERDTIRFENYKKDGYTVFCFFEC